VAVCPGCGEPFPPDARFCPWCGAKLGTETDAREERKVVSVLFLDLVGFTSHSHQADPEDVRDRLRTYHSHVKERVEQFGGTVEKFIGDAVMAVFGAPLAHTDDAERAVRAGLSALGVVEELNRQQPGLELAARAAVNTGEALVTVGTGHERGEALALGDVVNVASRLQTAAPTGQIVVGEETYRATREAIRYEPLSPIVARGKPDPLDAWLVVGPATAPGDRRMRATPSIGRDPELALLESLWQRATDERRPHLVTVVGPPGIGKSRLSREFAELAKRAAGRAIRGRCLPYDTQDVYCAFAQQVKGVSHIFEQDPSETARDKLAGAVATLFPEAERSDVTRSLSLLLGLGLDSPVNDQRLLLYSARRLVERLGAQQPTLFVFEDVHWADAAQLDLIAYLATHSRDSPVMFLALTRPELFDSRPDWGSGGHAQSTLALDPLSTAHASAIIRGLLPSAQPAHAEGRLVETAEGNPLFLEELAAALTEGADLDATLRTTVRAAIAGRIDALPLELRGALLAASVVGRVFWVGALRALGQPESVEEILDELETRDLLRRVATSTVAGDIEFSFKHILIRDVCYATLPRAERRSSHALVAGYIEQMSGANDRDLAWLLAHHWEHAGELGRAVDYLLIAADRAREAMAESDAMDLFERALRLAPDESARSRIGLLRALARVSFGDYDSAADELEALLPRLDERDLIEAQLGLARSYHWTERTVETLQTAEQALELAQRIGAEDFVGPATAWLSQAHAMRGGQGDLDRAVTLGEEALRTWVPGARPDDLAEHTHLLAHQYYWTGRPVRRRSHERGGNATRGRPGRHPSHHHRPLRGGPREL
jgi:class 3 adenylate cyclase/tetratricopeptide (TPR) repeat protein